MARPLHMIRTVERGQLGGSDLTSYRSPGVPRPAPLPAGWTPPAGTTVFRHVGDDPWEPYRDAIVDAVVDGITSVVLARHRTG